MTEKTIYNCSECGNYFRSSDNNIRYFFLLECQSCRRVSEEKTEFCKKCGGQLAAVTIPVCPKCESKFIETRGSINTFN